MPRNSSDWIAAILRRDRPNSPANNEHDTQRFEFLTQKNAFFFLSLYRRGQVNDNIEDALKIRTIRQYNNFRNQFRSPPLHLIESSILNSNLVNRTRTSWVEMVSSGLREHTTTPSTHLLR